MRNTRWVGKVRVDMHGLARARARTNAFSEAVPLFPLRAETGGLPMIKFGLHRTVAIALTLMAALVIVSVLPGVSLPASEEGTTHYAIELRLPAGEMVPLGEITVFGEDSWSYSVRNALVSGTFSFGVLPPRPDPETDKVAAIEVSSDDGESGFRAVLERFPAGGTLLVHQDGELFTEATVTYNPEAV